MVMQSDWFVQMKNYMLVYKCDIIVYDNSTNVNILRGTVYEQVRTNEYDGTIE